jgi:excisionase family DNA binding protein
MQAMDEQGHNSRWLTIQEVAMRLHVSRDTVERWISAGDLRAVNVGGRLGKESRRHSWRISSECLDAFLDARANRRQVRAPKVRRSARAGVIEFIK